MDIEFVNVFLLLILDRLNVKNNLLKMIEPKASFQTFKITL